MPNINRIGGLQNILGLEMPTLFVDGVDYQLPRTDVGNRQETFEKEAKVYLDLNNEIHERVRGFRLQASWEWDYLTAIEFNDLMNIFNAAKTTNDLKIKFATFPRRYAFHITNFEHDLADGRAFKSSASMEVEGLKLLNAFPDPDQFFTFPPMLGRGVLVRTLAEQGI